MSEELSPEASLEVIERMFAQPLPWWKRSLDVAGAALLLLTTWPLMLLVAAGIKLTSRGPVMFCQKRAGLGGVPFVIYKFRTMVVDAEQKQRELRQFSEQDGPAFKMRKDPRITWFGKLLRKTSLDELPQVFNVLKGDMSLVGPRPLPLHESAGCSPWQRQRLDVTPGLTCIWQVRGRSTVSFTQWMRMDVEYIRRRTLWTDLRLLFQTLPALVLRGGH